MPSSPLRLLLFILALAFLIGLVQVGLISMPSTSSGWVIATSSPSVGVLPIQVCSMLATRLPCVRMAPLDEVKAARELNLVWK